MLNILTFTALYPNQEQPSHGIFVENRLQALAGSGEVKATVVAPVGFFPFGSSVFGRYGQLARIPAVEERGGITVHHPRHLILPKIGMNAAARFMYLGVRKLVSELVKREKIDLIDAHYFYPDGVVASWLAQDLGLPFVITGRGSDLTELTDYPTPRGLIKEAAEKADALITVCEALQKPLLSLGLRQDKMHVFRNGVDLERFHPLNPDQIQSSIPISRPLFLSVGHLIPRKGHDLVIEALTQVHDAHLIIAGDGPEEQALKALSTSLGVQDRVRFVGRLSHTSLRELYSLGDALVLASSREGWANVLLESMACGTPVVATDVWGTGEVVRAPEAGLLVERDVNSIAEGMRNIVNTPPDREKTRAYAEQFSWEDTTQNQISLFRRILNKS